MQEKKQRGQSVVTTNTVLSNQDTLFGSRNHSVAHEKDPDFITSALPVAVPYSQFDAVVGSEHGDLDKEHRYVNSVKNGGVTADGRRTSWKDHTERDPFAGGVEGGVEYRSMAWWHAGMVMVAEIISLGILALPKSLATLGLIPGLVTLIFLGIMSTISGYVIGQLKLAHPHIHSMAEAGEILFGKIGRELFGGAQTLFYVFVMGSHILTFSIAMNAITEHWTCTIYFMLLGLVLSLLCTLPRTLKNLSYYSIASFISIIGAVVVTMIAVSVERPRLQPPQHHTSSAMKGGDVKWDAELRLWPKPDLPFHEAFLAVCNMVFAYAGNVAFFSFISELKKPCDFPKSLAFLQISDILMYIVTSVVIYYYAGNSVKSPALDSISHQIRKIAYGIALPTIVIAGVINGHVGVKYVYVRLFRDSTDDIMHQKRSVKAVGTWIAICIALWVTAWLIAEAVPVFSDLLGVTSALFASWFTYGLSGFFWIHLNFERIPYPTASEDQSTRWWRGSRWKAKKQHWSFRMWILFALNMLNILIGAVVCVVGLYAASMSIARSRTKTKPFGCADNSHGN